MLDAYSSLLYAQNYAGIMKTTLVRISCYVFCIIVLQLVSRLSNTVMGLEKERETQAAEMKRMKGNQCYITFTINNDNYNPFKGTVYKKLDRTKKVEMITRNSH